MLTLPPAIMACLDPFAPVFSKRVWQHVLVLVVGAILTPGQRMVTSVLRVTGLSHLNSFERYHRVVNRDVWSSLQFSRILLRLLVTAFVPEGPLVFGIDGTIERRRGAKIKAASYRGSRAPPLGAPAGHIVIRCAPAIATWSRSVGCAGSASCSWFPFPGRHVPGRSPS